MRGILGIIGRLPFIAQILIAVVLWYYGMRAFSAVAWLFAPLALICATFVFLGLAHELGYTRKLVQGRSWLMDILNRMTDKARLEKLMDDMQPAGARSIDAIELESKLKESVYGQDAVCRDVAKQIKNRFAKEIRNKPIGVFLLAGPPGTGKTWFAKVLSDCLPHSGDLSHFDMTQFSQPHMASQLFGQAKGYSGSETMGKLTGDLKSKPDRVILLDEIEKAHREVHTKFLSAWNDGFIVEASTAQNVSTKDAIFIVTTNAAQSKIAELTKEFANNRDELSQACKVALASDFAPEFLDRIDYVFPFVPLGNMDLARVIAQRMEQEIKEYGLEVVSIQPEVLVRSVKLAIQRNAGPRAIARMIEAQIAEQVIKLKEAGVKQLRVIDTGVVISVEAADAARPGQRL